jgi:fructose-1,6-bisphosphatase/inositol monophosphatase family enzyme
VTAFDDARDAARCVEILRTAAKSEIMPRFRRLRPNDIRTKSASDDLVTEADLAAEDAITKALSQDFPEALIVGEEAVAADAAALDALPEAKLAFVIDPVDGTWNFAAGLSTFGVILAVMEHGQTVMGLLYDPVLDDWVMARKGQGAWFGRPSEPEARRLALSGGGPIETATGLVTPFNFERHLRARLAAQLTGFSRVDGYRCSCHEYRMLVQGRFRFGLSGNTKVWDHAAGALAMEEAGGHGCMLDGRPYTPCNTSGRFLVADDAALLKTLSDRFAWLEGRDPDRHMWPGS